MSICRLCLNIIEGTGVSIVDFESIELIHKILPRVDVALKRNPLICEICCENTATAQRLQKTCNETNRKIQNELKRLKVDKINLRGFHQNPCNNVSVCRICLKLINVPKIFLCANNTNILRHDIIKRMLRFCNVNVNTDLSDRPVMCTNCWENLQISYTFKKCYIDVEKKIGSFCKTFKLVRRNFSPEILMKIRNYYSGDFCTQSCDVKQEENYYGYMFPKIKNEHYGYKISGYNSRKSEIKLENNDSGYSDTNVTPKLIRFSDSDNFILMRVYYEVTDNEQNFSSGYWKEIADKWEELMPNRKIPLDRLGDQINKVFSRTLISEADLLRIKRDVERQRTKQYSGTHTQTYNVHQALTYQNEDTGSGEESSDDSFVEDMGSPPIIKSEILNESDIEFNSIETKLEVESDCESLPQLERMDIPPLNFKIENIYSLEVKREVFDQYMMQEEMHANDEDGNKNRRSIRANRSDFNTSIFKCGECSFETKFSGCIERHKRGHQKGIYKMHQCPSCPYRISNKRRFQRHMRTHREKEDDIPVLEPFMIPI